MAEDVVLTPVLVTMLRFLSRVKSLEEHDSKLDDIAATSPSALPAALAEKKRDFRFIVATTMKRTGCSEEEAVTTAAGYIYGRLIAVIPGDGETQHG